jgi:hypothetical protein
MVADYACSLCNNERPDPILLVAIFNRREDVRNYVSNGIGLNIKIYSTLVMNRKNSGQRDLKNPSLLIESSVTLDTTIPSITPSEIDDHQMADLIPYSAWGVAWWLTKNSAQL